MWASEKLHDCSDTLPWFHARSPILMSFCSPISFRCSPSRSRFNYCRLYRFYICIECIINFDDLLGCSHFLCKSIVVVVLSVFRSAYIDIEESRLKNLINGVFIVSKAWWFFCVLSSKTARYHTLITQIFEKCSKCIILTWYIRKSNLTRIFSLTNKEVKNIAKTEISTHNGCYITRG